MFIIHVYGHEIKKETYVACNKSGSIVFSESLKEFEARMKKASEKHTCCKKCVFAVQSFRKVV